MSQNVQPYKVREAAEYLVTHGKLFKDQGISFDKTWAENNELSNNIDVNETSSLQIDTNVGEPYIDGRAISSDIPGEHQTGCSDWNDTLNLAVREGQIEFGKVIGVDEPQPGCSHWDGSLNNAVKEGQLEFGAVAEPASKSDDGNEIEGVIEFRVITGEGDEIEIELEPQNLLDQERQEKPGPISDREKQDHAGENDEEQWSDNEDEEIMKRQQLRAVGNKFLNAVEISAQEACYILLQLCMRKMSRQVIFVNTNLPEEKVFLLKPQSVFENMDDDDENIEARGLITHYAERPDSLENVYLADFACCFSESKTVSSFRSPKGTQNSGDGYLQENSPSVAAEVQDDGDDDDRVGDSEKEKQTDMNEEYRKRAVPQHCEIDMMWMHHWK